MTKSLLLFGVLIILSSCGGNYAEVKGLDWLTGKWKAKVQTNDVYESWSMVNDSTWTGESSFVKEGKTLFTEEMSIKMRNGKISFISSVSDQNEGKEVGFEMIENKDKKLVFENKTHDFPQKITYHLKDENNLHAFISGSLNGEKQQIDFNFTKTK